jgi:hypothetical protein
MKTKHGSRHLLTSKAIIPLSICGHVTLPYSQTHSRFQTDPLDEHFALIMASVDIKSNHSFKHLWSRYAAIFTNTLYSRFQTDPLDEHYALITASVDIKSNHSFQHLKSNYLLHFAPAYTAWTLSGYHLQSFQHCPKFLAKFVTFFGFSKAWLCGAVLDSCLEPQNPKFLYFVSWGNTFAWLLLDFGLSMGHY